MTCEKKLTGRAAVCSTSTPTPQVSAASLALQTNLDTHGQPAVVLHGQWTISGLGAALPELRRMLRAHAADRALCWDLRGVDALDSAGALLLWQSWSRELPAAIELTDRQRSLFDMWRQHDEAPGDAKPRPRSLARHLIDALAVPSRATLEPARALLVLLGQLLIDTLSLMRRPPRMPWREISATIHVAGARALPITGLVGLLIGVVIAYQSALQLRNYGAEIFIVDMLGFSVTRELGPLLAAIIVAGRSGSAITAQIGVMRLTQELDAMTTLGISVSRRLILPRVAALTLIMPLLALWTIVAAMVGGIVASQLTVGLGFEYFMATLPQRMPVANLWIGLGKSVVFGALIGLTATHLGLRVKPNTRDLGAKTTRSVVAAITLVIVLNALFSIVLRDVGFR